MDEGAAPSADAAFRARGPGSLRRRFPSGSPGSGPGIVGKMESAGPFPWLAVPGGLQGKPVRTGPVHVTAPTTAPAKGLPAMPLVAPTDNSRVFPRWSPLAISLAPKQSNIQVRRLQTYLPCGRIHVYVAARVVGHAGRYPPGQRDRAGGQDSRQRLPHERSPIGPMPFGGGPLAAPRTGNPPPLADKEAVPHAIHSTQISWSALSVAEQARMESQHEV